MVVLSSRRIPERKLSPSLVSGVRYVLKHVACFGKVVHDVVRIYCLAFVVYHSVEMCYLSIACMVCRATQPYPTKARHGSRAPV